MSTPGGAQCSNAVVGLGASAAHASSQLVDAQFSSQDKSQSSISIARRVKQIITNKNNNYRKMITVSHFSYFSVLQRMVGQASKNQEQYLRCHKLYQECIVQLVKDGSRTERMSPIMAVTVYRICDYLQSNLPNF